MAAPSLHLGGLPVRLLSSLAAIAPGADVRHQLGSSHSLAARFQPLVVSIVVRKNVLAVDPLGPEALCPSPLDQFADRRVTVHVAQRIAFEHAHAGDVADRGVIVKFNHARHVMGP